MDINDAAINESFSPEDVRVPFRNMVYIGDSDTDIPCMKLVNTYGGHSIGVYNGGTNDKTKVYKMMRDGRIKYFSPADYSEGTELDALVKAIIDRTAANEALESIHYRCKKERINADQASSHEEREKTDLIIELENSSSFAGTHSVISKLLEISSWTNDQKNDLCEIALRNSQILYILGDADVSRFYKGLLKNMNNLSEAAQKIKEAREQGDLSENAEYDAAKDEQRDIEARIEEIEKILKNAEVVVEEEVALDKISIGCTIRILDCEFNEELEYKIVGSTEANSLKGKISNESPVGRALIGAKVGDTVKVETQVGDLEYKVLEIQRSM